MKEGKRETEIKKGKGRVQREIKRLREGDMGVVHCGGKASMVGALANNAG